MPLLLIRGLPGSGKTTLAKTLQSNHALIIEANDYFMVDGEYRFQPTKLNEAHADCLSRVRNLLRPRNHRELLVIVTNTFVLRRHMAPYEQLARQIDHMIWSADLFDGGLEDRQLATQNRHGVPIATIAKMRSQYER